VTNLIYYKVITIYKDVSLFIIYIITSRLRFIYFKGRVYNNYIKNIIRIKLGYNGLDHGLGLGHVAST